MNWKEPFDILNLTRHSDSRGFLFEILRFADHNIPGQGQIYVFSVEPGKRRGEHYHLKKKEWFTCVFGEALVSLGSNDGPTTVVPLSPNEPKIIYAGPGTLHTFSNKGDQPAIIVSYSSQQHDSKDEDTYRQGDP